MKEIPANNTRIKHGEVFEIEKVLTVGAENGSWTGGINMGLNKI